ncbi:MAG: BlaI/MecI/CopY family transcriptional regulator [Candidatus Hydrogenedentes bacterium]|nr:BlaI/MecI/CopY family transcriptional regulator [Candidatus Hydrogenedentota bacterium]
MDALNPNELEVLRILWEDGEQKPPEIEAAFSWPIDNGTLRSVLRVLMGKDLVARRRMGKAYYYKAKKSREGVMLRMARQMAHVFSGGSTTDLIAQLIKTEKLTPQELAELRRIAQVDSNPAASKRRKR